jgi:outer membrane lipopolysaccharide assembly protein LptE/RlpB
MKKIKISLYILIIIGLSSCGYSRLNDQSNEFKFNSIEINGDKRLSYILKNNLNLLSKPESKKSYDLLINLTSSKTSKIKDTTGKTTRFNVILNGDLKLTDNNKVVKNRSFTVSNDYDVSNNHSDTIRNEKNSIQSNIDLLSEEITKYIQLINLN